MKIHKILIFFFVFILLFSGCKKNPSNSGESETDNQNQASLESLFTNDQSNSATGISDIQSEITQTPTNPVSSSSDSVNTSEKKEVSMEELLDKIKAKPFSSVGLIFDPEDPFTVPSTLHYDGGDFVFYDCWRGQTVEQNVALGYMLNGVYQEIKIEGEDISTDYALTHTLQIPANETCLYKISLRPNIGSKGDVLQFNSAVINNPTKNIKNEEELKNYINHVGSTSSLPFVMNHDSDHSAKINSSFSGTNVTDYNSKIRDCFTSINSSGELCQMRIYHDLDSQIYHMGGEFNELVSDTKINAESTTSFPLTVTLGGGKSGTTQRISFYLNGEMLPVFDGCYYADVPIVSQKQTDVQITIDTSKLGSLNHFYALAYTLGDSSFVLSQSYQYVLTVNG